MSGDAELPDLLDGACPAVLTTYRRDGSVLTSPVWVGRARMLSD